MNTLQMPSVPAPVATISSRTSIVAANIARDVPCTCTAMPSEVRTWHGFWIAICDTRSVPGSICQHLQQHPQQHQHHRHPSLHSQSHLRISGHWMKTSTMAKGDAPGLCNNISLEKRTLHTFCKLYDDAAAKREKCMPHI